MARSRRRDGGAERRQPPRRTPRRGRLAAALAALAPGTARAALPSAGEFRRTVDCIQSGRYLDITATTRPEELPPCVDACPFGTEDRWQQCVQPPPDEALEEVRLSFQLREHCLEADCGGLQHWDLHLDTLDLKVAQYLGVATQELHSALLFYPTVDTPWVSFESGNSSGSSSGPPERPSLKRFFMARRNDVGRRMDSSTPEKWYMVHTAYRVESARISLWSRAVREISESVNAAVSGFLGTDVEVLQPQANITARNFHAVSHADFRAVYEFEGWGTNRNPYVSDARSNFMPGTALGFECVSPCWEVDEGGEEFGGAHRCSGDCDCSGMRRCSPLGYCGGNAGTCAHSGNSATVPGYECRPSGGHGSASGSRFVALSPESCASTCDSTATCDAFEWHGPDFCFLIAQQDFQLPQAQPYGAWSVCKRSGRTTTTIPSQIWRVPFEGGDPLRLLSPDCRTALVRTTAREGLAERLMGCSRNQTATDPACLRVTCIGLHTVVADLGCQADLCAPDEGGGGLHVEPVGTWARACNEGGLVDMFKTAHASRCAQPTPRGGGEAAGAGDGSAGGDGGGLDDSEDSGGGKMAAIIACSTALPVMGCFCAMGRVIQLRHRRAAALRNAQAQRSKTTSWSPPDLSKSSSWHLPMAHEPPPQMSSPSSLGSRLRFGWPWTPGATMTTGEPSPKAKSFEETGVFSFGTTNGSRPGSPAAPASPGADPSSPRSDDSSAFGERTSVGSDAGAEPEPKTPATTRSARSAPTPRRLRSSPPMFSRQNRDTIWSQFEDGTKGRDEGANSPQSSTSPLGSGLRAAARESASSTAQARQPPTPSSAWADPSGQADGPAEDRPGAERPRMQRASSAGGLQGSRQQQQPQQAPPFATAGSPHMAASGRSSRPQSPTRKSRIYAPSADDAPGQAADPDQTWNSDTSWRAGPAAWTAASSSPKKRVSPSKSRAPARDEPQKEREALSPEALASELEKLRQSTSLPERRRYFLSQCLKWHPDKNAGNEARATQMFHVLQEKKDWFLGSGP